MIDFRYHLVSIVSIFLALAVGIALGAGPLKGTLSDTINSEIASLRSDKAKLNQQLATANRGIDERDAFIAATNGQLLGGRLVGQTVDLVVLPGTDGSLVKDTTATMSESGAKVGGTVEIKSAWVDPSAKQAREQVGDTLVRHLGLQPEDDQSDLNRSLATALQTDSEQTSSSVLKALGDAKLISVDRDKVTPATAVVVLSDTVDATPTSLATSQARAFVNLAVALDAKLTSSVLASNTAVDPGSGVSVVSTARTMGSAARNLSTVDDAGIPMGQASIALALLDESQGRSGQYGLGGDASDPFPAAVGS
ncbi:conserved exported hypothetical protein [Nostocoides japonicum T1-X7]|uniref:Uncharacterized protein n=1 Tax=Nostocoides japonicum T1-X7 TaxID=1194083 RepID=A0A077M1P4_9MICO|nr:copper transporter [Tetrasphaera japonica]CCH78119.1 conserved exported hypothetical protein [Tetrasphaera japonica T1-X7]